MATEGGNVAAEEQPALVSTSAPSRFRYISVAIIFFLWLVIYFASIFSPPLLDDVDTIHAEAAREMVLRHDWVTLYTDGIRYLVKAPLIYWRAAASHAAFGVHDCSSWLPWILRPPVLFSSRSRLRT